MSLNIDNQNIPDSKKKYAVCIYGQLRAVFTIYENFNRYLINELGADLYILAQDTKTDYINLFHTENKLIYQQPDVRNIFINYNLLTQRNNYIIDACLQVYYNFHKINEIFGDILENKYEYIILTRSDYLHICPFPNILNICNNTDLFWCYDGHEWGGVNITLVCIPSKYIREYLSSFYNYLQDSNNINYLNTLDLNAELFAKLLFDKFNWKIGKIEPNAFITATNLYEVTTWSAISYCPKKKVYYKYSDQLKRAFHSLQKYDNHFSWCIHDTTHILLKKKMSRKIVLYILISLFLLILIGIIIYIAKHNRAAPPWS